MLTEDSRCFEGVAAVGSPCSPNRERIQTHFARAGQAKGQQLKKMYNSPAAAYSPQKSRTLLGARFRVENS